MILYDIYFIIDIVNFNKMIDMKQSDILLLDDICTVLQYTAILLSVIVTIAGVVFIAFLL